MRVTYSITGDETTDSFTGAGAACTSRAGAYSITSADATYLFISIGAAVDSKGPSLCTNSTLLASAPLTTFSFSFSFSNSNISTLFKSTRT